MPSNRRVFFGNPPFQFLARHLAQDEDFLNDARRILKLDQGMYSDLVAQISKARVFLDRASLISLASQVLGTGDESRGIAAVIYQIAGVLNDAGMPVGEAMNELGKAIEEKADGLEANDRRILVDRLRALAADPAGLKNQYKARQLVDAIGSELDEFRFICDIRPIFDQHREQIEGAIPLVVLRFEHSTADGESAVVEVRVTEKQLEEFIEKITQAKRKLKLIRELLASQHLPIPSTKATLTEEEE